MRRRNGAGGADCLEWRCAAGRRARILCRGCSSGTRVSGKNLNVLTGLQDGGDSASTRVGDFVSADSVSIDVLLQLLVGIGVADHRAFVDPCQLRSIAARQRLLADAAALDVDRRASDDLLFAAGVSAGIFSFFP